MNRITIIMTVLVLVLSTGVLAADGPFQMGSKSFGGSFTFSNQSGDAYGDNSITIIGFNPAAGFFISDGTMFGGQVVVSYIDYGYIDETIYGLGPFVTHYFIKDPNEEVKGQFVPFVGGFATFLKDKISSSSLNQFSIGAKGGATYMISNAVGLSFGALFSMDRFSSGGASATGWTIQFAAGIDSFVF